MQALPTTLACSVGIRAGVQGGQAAPSIVDGNLVRGARCVHNGPHAILRQKVGESSALHASPDSLPIPGRLVIESHAAAQHR